MVRNSREHFNNGSAGYRMAELRRKLCKRFKYEAALGQARMRDLKIRRVDDGVVIKQDVDIDGARTFRHIPLTAELSLYFVNPRE